MNGDRKVWHIAWGRKVAPSAWWLALKSTLSGPRFSFPAGGDWLALSDYPTGKLPSQRTYFSEVRTHTFILSSLLNQTSKLGRRDAKCRAINLLVVIDWLTL